MSTNETQTDQPVPPEEGKATLDHEAVNNVFYAFGDTFEGSNIDCLAVIVDYGLFNVLVTEVSNFEAFAAFDSGNGFGNASGLSHPFF